MFTKYFFKTVSSVVKIVCCTHCLTTYVGYVVWCLGPSMEPTLYDGDVLIMKAIYKYDKLNKGDIIVLKSPNNPQENICKRIVGLPGDKVGKELVVPGGHVWVEGDNKSNSVDSRFYGPVPQGLLRGRALCRILPFNSISLFNDR